MSLTFNGTTVNAINFNGTALTKVTFNGVTVWEGTAGSNVIMVLNGTLQSGISRTIIEDSYATYPTTSQVVLSPDQGDDDGDGSYPAYCTVRYDKAIPGNGKKLYVQTSMTTDYYDGITDCTYKVQLVNVSTGDVTTLGQYACDWNTTIVDGVTVDATLFNRVNNTLTAYQLPTSGSYYVQFRYYTSDGETQNMTFSTVQCYTGD